MTFSYCPHWHLVYVPEVWGLSKSNPNSSPTMWSFVSLFALDKLIKLHLLYIFRQFFYWSIVLIFCSLYFRICCFSSLCAKNSLGFFMMNRRHLFFRAWGECNMSSGITIHVEEISRSLFFKKIFSHLHKQTEKINLLSTLNYQKSQTSICFRNLPEPCQLFNFE